VYLAQDIGQRLAQWPHTLSHSDAALDEEAATLIDHTRPLANETRAHAMQSQQVHLLRRLDRHEMHGRPPRTCFNRDPVSKIDPVVLNIFALPYS